jgi:hypothetical protein
MWKEKFWILLIVEGLGMLGLGVALSPARAAISFALLGVIAVHTGAALARYARRLAELEHRLNELNSG